MRLLFLLSFLVSVSCTEEIKDNLNVSKEQIKTTSEAQQFWTTLKSLCNKSFEGKLKLPENDEQFGGKRLVMHVRSCTDSVIKIPFFVGDDKSRTWILTLIDDRIELKHDHRHEDGSDDEITMYGGKTTNTGQDTIQVFPADQDTKQMIPAASTNVWWITLNDNLFTYNLKRLGTERVFRVTFDLTKTIENPEAPWGWKD